MGVLDRLNVMGLDLTCVIYQPGEISRTAKWLDLWKVTTSSDFYWSFVFEVGKKKCDLSLVRFACEF